MPLRCAGAAGVQEKIPPHCCGGIFESAIEESALGELGSPTGGLEAVFLDLQNLQSIALQWIAVFENQFPFRMNPVNFYHIV